MQSMKPYVYQSSSSSSSSGGMMMALRRRGMEKKMMMAPSTGYHGGGGGVEQAAFVAAAPTVNSYTLRRCSTTSLSSSSTAAASSSLYNEGDNSRSNSNDLLFNSRGGHQLTQMQQRQPRIDEPNLYNIPPNIYPTYRPIPLILRMIINVSSAILIARIKSWKNLISILKNVYHHLPSSLSFTQALTTTSTSNNIIINYMTLLKNVISIFLRYLIVSTLFKVTLQEVAYRPSRVTMEYLVENDLLPSTLSCYQNVCFERFDNVDDDDSDEKCGNADVSDKKTTQKTKRMDHQIGVHSLQYVNPSKYDASSTSKKANKEHDKNIDAISLHHGFGASSLSWLPILPSLVQQLDARVGVAHDSVGFGFTDRPHHHDDDSHLEKYSSEMNVGIGFELLKSVHKDDEDGVPSEEKKEKAEGEKNGKKRSNIAIFGHSMGAKAALQMALACSKRNNSDDDLEFNPSLVVLVAPALEGVALPSSSRGKKLVSGTSSRDTTPRRDSRGSISNKLSQVGSSIWVTFRKLFFHHPFRFGLRRLVGGTPNFWRKGLASAWGDPKRLSESDVLRFQWPSIGMGWEQGLLNLVRHKLSSSSSSSASSSAVLNDEQLLHRVSNMKDTKVVIIYGSRDRIVRFEGAVAEKVKQEFPNVHLVRMEGLGHDPFEENVEAFLNELKAVW